MVCVGGEVRLAWDSELLHQAASRSLEFPYPLVLQEEKVLGHHPMKDQWPEQEDRWPEQEDQCDS